MTEVGVEGVVDHLLFFFLQVFQFSNPLGCMHQLFPLLVSSYLRNFNMNYITFKTIEIVKQYLFKEKKITKENKECFNMYKYIYFT